MTWTSLPSKNFSPSQDGCPGHLHRQKQGPAQKTHLNHYVRWQRNQHLLPAQQKFSAGFVLLAVFRHCVLSFVCFFQRRHLTCDSLPLHTSDSLWRNLLQRIFSATSRGASRFQSSTFVYPGTREDLQTTTTPDTHHVSARRTFPGDEVGADNPCPLPEPPLPSC